MLSALSTEYTTDSILHIAKIPIITYSSAIHRSFLGTLSRHELLPYFYLYSPSGSYLDKGHKIPYERRKC
jgi:hypothetical protein